MTTAAPVDMDLSSLEFWKQPYEVRERAFKWLRDNNPVSWHRPPEPLAPGLATIATSPADISRAGGAGAMAGIRRE